MTRSHRCARVRALAGVAAAALLVIVPGEALGQSPCGESVTVSLGDTLAEIAANCGTTVSALVRANPDITDPNVIHVGQVITIPGGGEPPPQPEPPAPDRPGASAHTVSPGETLAGIARRYGTSVSALVRANADITNPNVIHVGQVITLPGGGTPQPRPEPPRQPRRVDAAMSPTSGPPGTRVRVTASGFPADAAVQVGSGRARSEYDITGRTRADAAGRVDVTVPVPEFADPGERWVFVLVAEDRSVEARTGEFQVTEPQGEDRVRVTGVLTREGVECPALRGDDGELYTLAGDIGDFEPGDRVQVEGTLPDVSICQQGTTITVEAIRPADA